MQEEINVYCQQIAVLGTHREPRAFGAYVCLCPGLCDAWGSSSLLSFTKVSSYGTEIFLWPQVCAERSNVNSQHRLLPSARIQYPCVLPTHHPNNLHPWPPKATLESELPETQLMAQIQQAPLLFDAVPRCPLAFVPAVAGVIMWVCLIVAIVRWMRRPIVLLRGELGPRHGGAGGDAAAGGSRRCSRICTGPRCLPGKPCEAAGTRRCLHGWGGRFCSLPRSEVL